MLNSEKMLDQPVFPSIQSESALVGKNTTAGSSASFTILVFFTSDSDLTRSLGFVLSSSSVQILEIKLERADKGFS